MIDRQSRDIPHPAGPFPGAQADRSYSLDTFGYEDIFVTAMTGRGSVDEATQVSHRAFNRLQRAITVHEAAAIAHKNEEAKAAQARGGVVIKAALTASKTVNLPRVDSVPLSPEDWVEYVQLARLANSIDASDNALLTNGLGDLERERDAFDASQVLDLPATASTQTHSKA
jgi:hypothetical protein